MVDNFTNLGKHCLVFNSLFELQKQSKYLRGRLHDTGMTFIPERVHSIPIYFSVSVYMIPRRNFAPHKSFRNDFIPVFNPNETLVLV